MSIDVLTAITTQTRLRISKLREHEWDLTWLGLAL